MPQLAISMPTMLLRRLLVYILDRLATSRDQVITEYLKLGHLQTGSVSKEIIELLNAFKLICIICRMFTGYVDHHTDKVGVGFQHSKNSVKIGIDSLN